MFTGRCRRRSAGSLAASAGPDGPCRSARIASTRRHRPRPARTISVSPRIPPRRTPRPHDRSTPAQCPPRCSPPTCAQTSTAPAVLSPDPGPGGVHQGGVRPARRRARRGAGRLREENLRRNRQAPSRKQQVRGVPHGGVVVQLAPHTRTPRDIANSGSVRGAPTPCLIRSRCRRPLPAPWRVDTSSCTTVSGLHCYARVSFGVVTDRPGRDATSAAVVILWPTAGGNAGHGTTTT